MKYDGSVVTYHQGRWVPRVNDLFKLQTETLDANQYRPPSSVSGRGGRTEMVVEREFSTSGQKMLLLGCLSSVSRGHTVHAPCHDCQARSQSFNLHSPYACMFVYMLATIGK